MTSKSDIECELENVRIQRSLDQERLAVIAQQRGATWEKRDQITAELKARIAALEAPLTAEIAVLDEEQKTLENRRYTLDWSEKRLGAQVGMVGLTDIRDPEDARVVLMASGVSIPSRNGLEVVKRLKNGIVIVRCHDGAIPSEALAAAYFAFVGLEVVGFQFTSKSQHPGDEATYWAWANQPRLRSRNQLLADRQMTSWNGDIIHGIAPLQYKQWARYLEGLTAPFVALDLTDEITQEILREDYAISVSRGRETSRTTTWNDDLAQHPRKMTVLTIAPAGA